MSVGVVAIIDDYRRLTQEGGPACCDRLMRLLQRDIRISLRSNPQEVRMKLNERGKREVRASLEEVRGRIERRLDHLRLRLSDLQQEVDDLVAIDGAVRVLIEELERE